jgi:hypothetical protein
MIKDSNSAVTHPNIHDIDSASTNHRTRNQRSHFELFSKTLYSFFWPLTIKSWYHVNSCQSTWTTQQSQPIQSHLLLEYYRKIWYWSSPWFLMLSRGRRRVKLPSDGINVWNRMSDELYCTILVVLSARLIAWAATKTDAVGWVRLWLQST